MHPRGPRRETASIRAPIATGCASDGSTPEPEPVKPLYVVTSIKPTTGTYGTEIVITGEQLRAAHAKNVIHRDVKLGNILVYDPNYSH